MAEVATEVPSSTEPTEVRCQEKTRGGLKYEVILGEPEVKATPPKKQVSPKNSMSVQDIEEKLKAAEERRQQLESSKMAALSAKILKIEEASRKKDEQTTQFISSTRDALEQKMGHHVEKREAYITDLRSKLKDHIENVEKTRLSLEQQTEEVRTQIEEKLKCASQQRDDNIKKMLERLKEHEEQIQKVREQNSNKLQQLDTTITEKLVQAQTRKEQREQEQKEKLKNHDEQVNKVREQKTVKLQQLDNAIQEKLVLAQTRKEQLEQEQKEKLKNHYGLFDIPSDFNTDPGDDEEGDSDLEAELAALSSGSNPTVKKPVKKVIPDRELQAMVADTMKDMDDDDDESVDENDPDLLEELNELTGSAEETEESPSQEEPQLATSANTVSVLSKRIKNYESAEKIAKECGESSKARRYGRATKTLKDLLKQAQSGKPVNLNDESVPPEIDPNKVKPTPHPVEIPSDVPLVPSRAAPTIPETPSEETSVPRDPADIPIAVQEKVEEVKANIDEELLSMLSDRQKEYKVAALRAKKSDDGETAIKFVRIAKQFDLVIEAVQNGQPVDLSKMPGPPGEAPTRTEPKTEENNMQQTTLPEITVPEAAESLPEPVLKTATTVLEALEQRLSVYKEHEAKAKEEGNSSKARRHGRIIKQFEQAIKAHKAGKPVAFDELPTPPGYGPIPGQVPSASASQDGAEVAPRPAVAAPVAPPRKKAEGDDASIGSAKNVPGGSGSLTTHAQKQVLILAAKQKQFKEAALNAKKQGDLVQAKEFLRQAKGFEKLIEAAQAGLPIDWSSIPVSPDAKSQLDNELSGYEFIMAEEVSEDSTVDSDVLSRLENQLQKQLKMCLTTRDHNKAIGDVAGTNKFERLALNVTKDLDVLRVAKRTSRGPPKFHYEMKSFAIVKSFPEIMDNQMEVSVNRGINYQSDNPKDIDTYVKLEFPFPQLMDGRKKVGGMLEVQIKLRSPIVTQQVENIQEKWLIIDQ
ncbi:unnamed protein product [Phaedon cochleariae]|uniref:DM14 domain-containing protein n=1 Tax=Phaedon cochleariae TaxID=80249 RepID=A0A9N9X5M8_PHACE|nr:unnamed protein product [Phaedon cochleariae]